MSNVFAPGLTTRFKRVEESQSVVKQLLHLAGAICTEYLTLGDTDPHRGQGSPGDSIETKRRGWQSGLRKDDIGWQQAVNAAGMGLSEAEDA